MSICLSKKEVSIFDSTPLSSTQEGKNKEELLIFLDEAFHSDDTPCGCVPFSPLLSFLFPFLVCLLLLFLKLVLTRCLFSHLLR